MWVELCVDQTERKQTLSRYHIMFPTRKARESLLVPFQATDARGMETTAFSGADWWFLGDRSLMAQWETQHKIQRPQEAPGPTPGFGVRWAAGSSCRATDKNRSSGINTNLKPEKKGGTGYLNPRLNFADFCFLWWILKERYNEIIRGKYRGNLIINLYKTIIIKVCYIIS